MDRDEFDVHPPVYEIMKRKGPEGFLEGGERGFSVRGAGRSRHVLKRELSRAHRLCS